MKLDLLVIFLNLSEENILHGGKCVFHWHTFDLNSILPKGWDQQIIDCASAFNTRKSLVPTSVTSRESEDVHEVNVATVGGLKVQEQLPWLFDLYRGTIQELANRCFLETVSCAIDPRYAINLNLQYGTGMRYEAHVDSNPVEALLYVTTHDQYSGGELVVANKPHVWGVEEIKSDCTRIWPQKGHLVFFDARFQSHFVEALKKEDDQRVVVAMNFYTPSCNEGDRPEDLDAHLGLI